MNVSSDDEIPRLRGELMQLFLSGVPLDELRAHVEATLDPETAAAVLRDTGLFATPGDALTPPAPTDEGPVAASVSEPRNHANLPDLVAVDDARSMLGGVSRATLFRLLRAGELSRVKIRGRTFLRKDDIAALIARGS